MELIAQGACPLRSGVGELLAAAQGRGQRLAIATTTSRANIEALLTTAIGTNWGDMFVAVVAGDEVPRKKPAPDVYQEVLRRLDLPASECLAFEDSGNGLKSAGQAGVSAIATRSLYFRDDDLSDSIVIVEELAELGQ